MQSVLHVSRFPFSFAILCVFVQQIDGAVSFESSLWKIERIVLQCISLTLHPLPILLSVCPGCREEECVGNRCQSVNRLVFAGHLPGIHWLESSDSNRWCTDGRCTCG